MIVLNGTGPKERLSTAPNRLSPITKKAVRRHGDRRVRRLVFRRLLDTNLVARGTDLFPKMTPCLSSGPLYCFHSGWVSA
jgi:hypothetical protein